MIQLADEGCLGLCKSADQYIYDQQFEAEKHMKPLLIDPFFPLLRSVRCANTCDACLVPAVVLAWRFEAAMK